MDIIREEHKLGQEHVGAGCSLYATPTHPLPRHGEDPQHEGTIAAGFPYTPGAWSSASATALAFADDGCGASMALAHENQQPVTILPGDP